MSNLSNSSIYTSEFSIGTIEKAILLEEIILPDFPPFPSHSEIKEGNVYYPRPEELYEDTIGKFSIPVITPLSDNTGSAKDTNVSPTARNIVNSDCNLQVSSYQNSNYIELNIPRYILLNFIYQIPAGTEFLVAFIGSQTCTDQIKIIGVC